MQPLPRHTALRLAALLVLCLCAPARGQGVAASTHAPFPNFESGPVRALLLSPDGTRLYWLNTPDHRVEILDTGAGAGAGLTSLGAVFTGLQPVSMALHPDDDNRLFVVNELSDDLVVIDLERRQVLARIPVGDAPADVVVTAGRVFVSTARSSPAPEVPGSVAVPGPFIDDALVVVSAEPPYAILARRPVAGHRPRSLAVVGNTVHVAALHSGNRTTSLSEEGAKSLGVNQFDLAFFDDTFAFNPALTLDAWDQSPFADNQYGQPGWAVPVTGRILFSDELPGVLPDLPDVDVAAFDAVTLEAQPAAHGVGTTLLAMAARPDTDELWVAGTDARNRMRFEPALQGRAVENRLSIVGSDGSLRDVLALAPPLTAREHAQPAALAFDTAPPGAPGHGAATVYVAALGSATVLALDADSGAVLDEVDVPPLPTALAVDAVGRKLYVFSRGTRELSVHALLPGHPLLQRVPAPGHDPEPAVVRSGRRQMYEARADGGHGNGNMSCATCHVSGHADQLAWDLGNPQGGLGYIYPDLLAGAFAYDGFAAVDPGISMTHPMKGPMTTQSLRGLMVADGPPLHWRGDRRFFQTFRGAFVSLLGGGGISPADMQALTGFVRTLTWPPNPLQPADRQYRGEAAAGFEIYGLDPAVPGLQYDSTKTDATCQTCHSADLAGKTDFTGSDRRVVFDGNTQVFNPGGFRGAYEREYRHKTGFGLLHDGTVDDVRDFMDDGPNDGVPAPFPVFDNIQKQQLTEIVRAWDTGMAPLVGRQFVAHAGNLVALAAWLDLAEPQALDSVANIDLVARAHLPHGSAPSQPIGLAWAREPVSHAWRWRADVDVWVDDDVLEFGLRFGLIEMAFTCVPRGQGERLGLDRDEDGLFDGLERARGSDPADPDSDDDGYDDALEVLHGGDPLVFTPRLAGDVTAPVVLVHEARDVFNTTATLHALLSEPGRLSVDVFGASGGAPIASLATTELRRRHDLVLDGLPAGTALTYRLRTTDTNGNSSGAAGSFATTPPMLHVADITLQKQSLGGTRLTAVVTVVDQDDLPAVNVPVRGLWVGDIGGAAWSVEARTDALGRATFGVGPYTPAGTSVVSFSPAYVGSSDPADDWFVGHAGDTPTFFYDAASNVRSYRQIVVP